MGLGKLGNKIACFLNVCPAIIKLYKIYRTTKKIKNKEIITGSPLMNHERLAGG